MSVVGKPIVSRSQFFLLLFVTANATESTYFANERLWPNRTRANTTDWDNKVQRVRVRSPKSLNETLKTYENASTDETTARTNTTTWITDVESTTIDYSTDKLDSEPFLLVNTLTESR